MASETTTKFDLPSSKLEAVQKAADHEGEPTTMPATIAASATDWFLSSDIEEVAWAYVPVNVAPAGKPETIIDFKVQVVDRDEIRRLRRQAEQVGPSGAREINEMEANLRIVVAGLMEPNLSDEKMRTVRGQYFADPADALQARFAHKPGLIDQLATKVMEISGYNDSDVKEVKAAGN